MSVRILQLVPEPLPTFRADVTVLFGKYLPRHGIRCDLVGKGSPAPLVPQGFSRLRRSADRAGRLRRELGFAWLCWRALWGAHRGNCDLIQVRDMVSIGLMAMLVAKIKGLPFVYWVSYLMSEARIERARRDLARRPSLRNWLVLAKGRLEYWLLYRLVLPRAQHVFAQSDTMCQTLRARGLAPQRLSSVPMGVDMELLGEAVAPQRLEGWEEGPLLAYLGTLDAARKLELVVDALAVVRREFPTARLLLIGAAPRPADLEQLQAHIAGCGLQLAVRVTGWLPTAQAWQLLAGADCAISYIPRGAILDTGSPTKLLEYLALGIPCVGNDNPDQAQVLEASDAGCLVRSDDAAALAEGMCAVLRDPAAARARAGKGTAYIGARRSYAAISRAVAEQYHRLRRG